MLHGDPKIAHEHVLQDRETYAAIRDGDPMSVPFQKKASPCGKGELAVSLNGVRPDFLAEDRFMQKPMEHLTFLYHKSKYMWVHCLRCQTTVGIWKVKGSEAETADAMDKLNRFLLTDKQSYKEYKKMIRASAATPSQDEGSNVAILGPEAYTSLDDRERCREAPCSTALAELSFEGPSA